MSPVVAEELLVFVEKSPAQSANDPLTIFLPDPEDPEDFQPLFFPNRPLPCEAGQLLPPILALPTAP